MMKKYRKLIVILLLLNYITCTVLLEFALKSIKPFFHMSVKDKERDDKYPEFRRNDLEYLKKKNRFHFPFSRSLILLRWLVGWGAWMVLFIVYYATSFIRKGDSPYKGWTTKVTNFFFKLTARITLFVLSWQHKVHVEERHVDYKKYLGPDWKQSECPLPSSIVTNHTSWLDIVV